LLFDLYGTLFISGAGDIAAGPAEAGPGAGPPGRIKGDALAAMQDHFRREVERRHWEARETGTAWPEVTVEEIWAAYGGPLPPGWDGSGIRELALRYELALNPVYPMPGAEDRIRTLAAAGFILGIISNAQFFSPLLFSAFFGAPPEKLGFDPALLIYSFTMKEAKPSPRLFAKARKVLAARGIGPEETLYIGNDMRNDIIPGAAAGFETALFAGDRRSLRLREGDSACAERRPRLVLRNLQSLAGSR
jgi:putative hydrolase of the HAD superfamily